MRANDEILLRMTEDGSFGIYEPYATVECETKEDYDRLFELVELGKSIVRCKDCKWWNSLGCAIYIADDSDKPKQNDYCSFGERKQADE